MGITQPTLTPSQADAVDGTVHSETGVALISHLQPVVGPPDLVTLLTQERVQILNLLAAAARGAVLDKKDGTKVIVLGVPRYVIGGTVYSFPDTDPFTCTDDETNYLYADSDGVVETNISAFPANVLKLAVVVCSGGAVTSVNQALIENHPVGSSNLWYNVAAGGTVDMGGNDLDKVGFLKFAAITKTLSGDGFTPDEAVHLIDGEGAADDDLVTITAVSGERKTLLIFPAAGRTITVKTTGNISFASPTTPISFAMTATSGHALMLYQDSDTTWKELWRRPAFIGGKLASALEGNGFGARQLEGLGFKELDRTIAAGVIDTDINEVKTFILVDTESGDATDDLDAALYTNDGDLLILTPKNDARTVVVKHAVGAAKFKLANGLDFTMDTSEHVLVCIGIAGQWVEMFRSPMIGYDLVADPGSGGTGRPGRALPHALGPFFISGAIAVQTYVEFEAWFPFTIIKAAVRDVVGPTAGPNIWDVQINGDSMFGDDSERPNIPDAGNASTSATKNKAVAAGDVVKILCTQINGTPADATVNLHVLVAPQTPP